MSPRVKPVLRGRRWKKGDIQGITPEELQAMIKVSKDDRYANRNACMLLVGFSFGLRVSELLNLKLKDIDLDNAQIHLERAKNIKTNDPAIYRALLPNLNE
jgi:integrase